MSDSLEDRRIRSLRPPRGPVDVWRPVGVLREQERSLKGPVTVATVFLAGAECPFACIFCDLWKYTTAEPTPEGALPAQLEAAMAEIGELPRGSMIKLYNASNFFDTRAVPTADLSRIAALTSHFDRVVVECHPRLVGKRLFEFSDAVDGRLEIAMGLESVHPQVLPRLNKKMAKEDYDRAAEALGAREIPHRAFVLIGVPFLDQRERIDWAVVSVAYAVERGAETVTLIPVRSGNGELERLAAEGVFEEPGLSEIEAAFDRSLSLPGDSVVQVDLWDLEKFSRCQVCFSSRAQRLQRMNLSGVREEILQCEACGDTGPQRIWRRR